MIPSVLFSLSIFIYAYLCTQYTIFQYVYLCSNFVQDLHLIRPIGLLSLLDEESSLTQSTDASCVLKFNDNFGFEKTGKKGKKHVSYVQSKSADSIFTIIHYAGEVVYSAKDIVNTNRDSLAQDDVLVFQKRSLFILCIHPVLVMWPYGTHIHFSSKALVSSLFLGTINEVGAFEPGEIHDFRSLSPSASAVTAQRRNTITAGTSRRTPSLSTQFRNSLDILVKKMTACRPNFVRCIKPNTEKAPCNYVDQFVRIQLNYTGMLETIRIRREGYAVRPVFGEFLFRFKCLRFRFHDKVPETIESCKKVLDFAQIKGWLAGRTKVFLKYYHVEELDQCLNKVNHYNNYIFQQNFSILSWFYVGTYQSPPR